MVAAKGGDEIIGRYEYTCNMNSKLFELWFVEVLLKLIPTGSVIVLDNASWHRKKILKKLAEASGCRVIFLPPYSPNFKPIELMWFKVKSILRKLKPRTSEELISALGKALDSVTPGDIRAWFKHHGYGVNL